MNCVLNILNKFCSMSGQQISQEKSRIFYSKNIVRSMRDMLGRMSGFGETMVLGKYLGVPLIGKANRKEEYCYVIDRVSAKLTSWKGNQLAFVGIVTLAKSVLKLFQHIQ